MYALYIIIHDRFDASPSSALNDCPASGDGRDDRGRFVMIGDGRERSGTAGMIGDGGDDPAVPSVMLPG